MGSESFAWAGWAPQGGKPQPGLLSSCFLEVTWDGSWALRVSQGLPAEPSALLWCLQASWDPIVRGAQTPRISQHPYLASVCQVLVLTEVPFLPVSRRIMQLPREILTKPHTQFCGKWFCFHQSVFSANTLLTFLHCVLVSHSLLSPSSPFPFFQPLRA